MSAMPAYNYGSQAYAYSTQAPARRTSDPRTQTRPQTRPSVRPTVVPGNAPRTSTSVVPEPIAFTVKVVAVAMVIVALAAFAYIGLRSLTMSTELETKAVSAQLSEARSAGYDLELAESSLANPTNIRTAAAALGMGTAAETETIELPADAVVIDENGTLKLTDTILKSASLS